MQRFTRALPAWIDFVILATFAVTLPFPLLFLRSFAALPLPMSAATSLASRDALVEQSAAALVQAFANYNAEYRMITRARAATLRSARLARKSARRGGAHRALRQERQSRRCENALATRRRGDGTRCVEQHQAAVYGTHRGASRSGVRQDILQLGHAPHVRHGRRGRRGRICRARLRPHRLHHLDDRNERLHEPRLARTAVRGSAHGLPVPHALRRSRPQRAHHHERSARDRSKPMRTPRSRRCRSIRSNSSARCSFR